MWILYLYITVLTNGTEMMIKSPIASYSIEADCTKAKTEIWAQMDAAYSLAEQQKYYFKCQLQGT